ncbi:MAG: hypothetical protein CBD77_01135 [bacterium TMED217]|nr:MAG: hypothetical protein CBD77_01135 [bacterium TMED217]
MRYFLVFLLFLSKIISQNIDEQFFSANNYYNSSNYLESIELYEKILDEGWESSNLYYNLGNAYYRQGMIGQSIWSYNKALRINPRNSDIKHNLEILNARIKDRIVLPDEFFLVRIYMKIKSRYNLEEWLFIGSTMIFISVIFFLLSKLYIFDNFILDRSLIVFIVTSIIIHVIILDRFLDENDNRIGVIIDNSVDAYSGPFYGDNTILFKINEGTKVKIVQAQNNWIEIILLNGNSAWVPLEKIRQL